MRRLGAWIDERTGLVGATRALLSQPVPGGASWFFVLGAMATFLLALLFVTGVFLAFYYSPSASTAWASVAFIQDELTFGWFVRGLHSFGSSALVVVSALHLLQVLVWGAYKAPRELNWLVGLVMLLLVVLFAMTGYGLPWDQKGYWAKLVETSIVGTTPGVGPALEKIAQGGSAYGNYTVTHIYALHVFVLPAATLALLGLHLYLVFRQRVTHRWTLSDTEAARRTEPYWPGQAFRDAVGSAFALAVVAFFVLRFGGAELEGPADPGSGYMARPEWYAIPLYQLRMYFEGPMEIVATMVIPGLLGGLIVALPFLDRGPARSPRQRPGVMMATVLGLVGTGVLSALSISKDMRDPEFQKHRAEIAKEAAWARQLARRGVLPEGGLAVFKNDPDYEVRALFKDECASCHPITGAGDAEGPDLDDYNSRAWILAFLRDPQGPRFMGGASKPEKGSMKPVQGTDEELAALTEFVYAFAELPDVDKALAEKGQALFEDKNCDSCHDIDGTSDARGPNLLGRGTLDYTKRLIEDASLPVFYGERAKMPKFTGKLSPAEIESLAKFVLSLKKS
jgi:ubiquinol-cytochrome c reductase cytochrome b subunit